MSHGEGYFEYPLRNKNHLVFSHSYLEASHTGQRLIVIGLIFYSSVLTYVLCAQKNRLIETVHLSTCNICFG